MEAHAPVGKESKIRLNGSAMVLNRQTSHIVSCFNSKTLLFVDPISRRSLRLTIEDLKGATPAVMTAAGNSFMSVIGNNNLLSVDTLVLFQHIQQEELVIPLNSQSTPGISFK